MRIGGRRTSVRLDRDTWDALDAICREEGIALADLCSRIDGTRGRRSLASALRIEAVRHFRCRFEAMGGGEGSD
ncbi:MAG: ribbon-helix-helix domain-containing protein [Alphaproteobacteria bacterium]